MKKIKNSFALLVVLITVGFTLMSHKSIFKIKDGGGTSRCFKPDLTVKYNCGSFDFTLTSTSTCSFARNFAGGAHIFNLDPNDYIEAEDIAITCFGQDSFCCATLLPDETWWGNLEAPCLDQPYFTLEGTNDQWEIDQVYCKLD